MRFYSRERYLELCRKGFCPRCIKRKAASLAACFVQCVQGVSQGVSRT